MRLKEAVMAAKTYQAESKFPGQEQQDVNANAAVARHERLDGPRTDKPLHRSAYEIKEVHRRLPDFSDDLLKQIPVLLEGTRLDDGATYLDLTDPARREFTATGDMRAAPDRLYVPKSETDYHLWNRLIGVTNPARTGGLP
jgi:hypothetical protein